MGSRNVLSVYNVAVALFLHSCSAVFAQGYRPPVRPGMMGMGQCPEGSVSTSGSGSTSGSASGFSIGNESGLGTICAEILSTDSNMCVSQYSSQSCQFCRNFERLHGLLPLNNTEEFCSNEEVSVKCGEDLSSCIRVTDADEDDQFLCDDACVLFALMCVPRSAKCANFGNEIYQECFNLQLLSITEYSCYCFAPGMTCSLCRSVVELCAPSSSSTSSPAASPTPTPETPPTLPPDAEQDFNSLSAEQQENSVTVEFTGISRDVFLRVELLFRQGIINAVCAQLCPSGQNLSADDVIFITPCPCERPASSRRRAFDGALEVPIFIQSSEPGSAVSADTVVRAVNESGADIALEIRATFAGVEKGVPDDVIPEEEEHDEDDDGGLTNGEVAAIVIAVVIIVIVIVLIVVGVLIWQSKRYRSYDIATDSHDKRTATPDSTDTFQVGQSSEHEKLAESHPIELQPKEGTQPVTSSDEAAVEQEQREVKDKAVKDEDKERKEDLKPLLMSSDQDTPV